jgi:hypothetical protein
MQLSYHALEQITARNITESQIETALRYGAAWTCPHDPDIRYVRKGSTFVVLAGGDWVLTAYKLED